MREEAPAHHRPLQLSTQGPAWPDHSCAGTRHLVLGASLPGPTWTDPDLN